MALAKALGGGFPVGACLATEEAAKGMTPGTHGSTFGGNPLAMAVGNAVLDVVLEPESVEHVRQMSLLLKQRLAEIKDRYASVVAEVRGEGLLMGLKLIPPAGAMVDELRAEKMITVAAGDNVVRLLPPLIINEDEIGEAVNRIERACARLAEPPAGGRSRRHDGERRAAFPRPHRYPEADARTSDRFQPRHEGGARAWALRQAARRQDAGDDLRQAVDAHPRLLRRRHAPARRRLDLLTAQEMQLGRGETLADTARVLSRFVDAIVIRTLDHEAVAEIARHATVPVINGLTRRSHPCQVLADVMTFEEKKGPIRGRTVAWTGDANNVLASWMHAAERFEFRL